MSFIQDPKEFYQATVRRHFEEHIVKFPPKPFTTTELLTHNNYQTSTNFRALASYLRSLGYVKKAARVDGRVRDVWVRG